MRDSIDIDMDTVDLGSNGHIGQPMRRA